MKTKVLILLMLFFCMISCDISRSVIINGKKAHKLFSECGTITMAGSSFPTFPVAMGYLFDGNYHINMDSLKMTMIPNSIVIIDTRFELSRKDFIEKEAEVKVGESLSIHFKLKSDIPFRRSEATLLILPSNFITCEGKPMITDTIKIRFRE